MNLKEAKLLFRAGALPEAVIRRHEGGWVVLLDGRHPLQPELEAARGHVRVFKTVDAAVGVLFELGFSQATLILEPVRAKTG